MLSEFTILWRSDTSPELKSAIEEQLESFSLLENNWSVMNEGELISQEVISRARTVYFKMRNLGLDQFEVQPGLSGEILICGQQAGEAIEIIVNPDGSYEFYLEKNGEEMESKLGLNNKELLSNLIDLNAWNISEYSNQNITKNQRQDTPGWPLNHPQGTEVSQYSVQNAPYRIVDQSVGTFKSTIAA